jgi:hypothetical protein
MIMEKRAEVETLEMFIQRNISKWSVSATKFNKGNINILQFAYYAHIRAKHSKKQKLPLPVYKWFTTFGQKQLFYLPLVVEPFQTSMFML